MAESQYFDEKSRRQVDNDLMQIIAKENVDDKNETYFWQKHQHKT